VQETELYTVAQVVERLHLSRKSVYDRIELGELCALRLSRLF
jgi:hypothetical protein